MLASKGGTGRGRGGRREKEGMGVEGGYLDNDEAGAVVVGGLEVDASLVVGDVEALD